MREQARKQWPEAAYVLDAAPDQIRTTDWWRELVRLVEDTAGEVAVDIRSVQDASDRCAAAELRATQVTEQLEKRSAVLAARLGRLVDDLEELPGWVEEHID